MPDRAHGRVVVAREVLDAGPELDEQALVAALKSGTILAAGLAQVARTKATAIDIVKVRPGQGL